MMVFQSFHSLSLVEMSLYCRFKDYWYGRPERIIVLGLDAAGKTTFLWRIANHRRVETTIPTIGFNVETIEISKKVFISWDVGGCDKIRPLWRHYTQDATGLIFFVDSNDRDRIDDARHELSTILSEDSMRDVPLLVVANKQDIANSLRLEEMTDKMGLMNLRGVNWMILPAATTAGTGIGGIMEWVDKKHTANLKSSHLKWTRDKPRSVVDDNAMASETIRVDEVAADLTIQDWIDRKDVTETTFLEELDKYKLNIWDHYTHIRIGWILIKDYGIKDGFSTIETALRSFIERSGRTDGRTFHATMTRFWCHMIAYAIEHVQWCDPSVDRNDFKAFLRALDEQRKLFDPPIVPLWDKKLFQRYYSNPVIFSADARTVIERPDVASLPDLLDLLQEQQRNIHAITEKKKALVVVVVPDAAGINEDQHVSLHLLQRDIEFLDSARYWSAKPSKKDSTDKSVKSPDSHQTFVGSSPLLVALK